MEEVKTLVPCQEESSTANTNPSLSKEEQVSSSQLVEKAKTETESSPLEPEQTHDESTILRMKAFQVFAVNNLTGEDKLDPTTAKLAVAEYCENDLGMSSSAKDELVEQIWGVIN